MAEAAVKMLALFDRLHDDRKLVTIVAIMLGGFIVPLPLPFVLADKQLGFWIFAITTLVASSLSIFLLYRTVVHSMRNWHR